MVWRKASNGREWRFGGQAALWMLLLAAACSAGCDSANPGQKLVGKWREMTPAVAPDPAAPAGIVSSASADPPPGPAPSPQGPKWGNMGVEFFADQRVELRVGEVVQKGTWKYDHSGPAILLDLASTTPGKPGNTWTVFYDSKKDELELLMMGLQRA